MKSRAHALNVLGLTLGLLAGMTATGFAQSSTKNITSGTGFNVCQTVDAPDLATAQGYTVVLTIDGSPATVPQTWRAAQGAGKFEVLLPESLFPSAARTIGRHDYTIQVGAVLADGSIAGSTVSDFYNIVDPAGPKQGVPKWIRIIGTIVKNVRAFLGSLI